MERKEIDYLNSNARQIYLKDKPLSPVDPIGELIVGSAILGMPLKLIGKPIGKLLNKAKLKLVKKNIKPVLDQNQRNKSFIERAKVKGFDVDGVQIADNPTDGFKFKYGKYDDSDLMDQALMKQLTDVYNTNPSIVYPMINSKSKFVLLNKNLVNKQGLPLKDIINHERHHVLTTPKEPIPNGVYNLSKSGHAKYFGDLNNDELAARGSQLKSYFGKKSNEQLTQDELKYAKENYVKDTNLDNDMHDFFKGIVNWKEMAKWLSKNSITSGLFGYTIGKQNKSR